MTAGATIVSGTKTAITSNIYAKASVSGLRSGLDKVYVAPMIEYLNGLQSASDDTKLDIQTLLLNLQLLHGNCSLAEAEIFIDKTVSDARPLAVPRVANDTPAAPVGAASGAVAAKGHQP